MYDGIIRTLKDVRYIPNLKKNLISLGQLDIYGLTHKVERGIMNVMKGSIVVMKTERKNGLFKLLGDTCIHGNGDESIVMAIKSDTTSNKDKTKLWHSRLGHMGEKGLHILSKLGLFGDDQISKIDQCESYIMGKQHRLSFKLGSHNSKDILEYIHIC